MRNCSARWRGEIVFTCTYECAMSYAWHRGDWKKLYDQQRWRDLAVAVIKTGYWNDLSYFYLAETAKGLKLPDTAKKYYALALEAAKAEKTCAGGLMDTCDGIEVGKLAQAALGNR